MPRRRMSSSASCCRSSSCHRSATAISDTMQITRMDPCRPTHRQTHAPTPNQRISHVCRTTKRRQVDLLPVRPAASSSRMSCRTLRWCVSRVSAVSSATSVRHAAIDTVSGGPEQDPNTKRDSAVDFECLCGLRSDTANSALAPQQHPQVARWNARRSCRQHLDRKVSPKREEKSDLMSRKVTKIALARSRRSRRALLDGGRFQRN